MVLCFSSLGHCAQEKWVFLSFGWVFFFVFFSFVGCSFIFPFIISHDFCYYWVTCSLFKAYCFNYNIFFLLFFVNKIHSGRFFFAAIFHFTEKRTAVYNFTSLQQTLKGSWSIWCWREKIKGKISDFISVNRFPWLFPDAQWITA